MIRRPPRSTHCISSAASDVYKRQSHTIIILWMKTGSSKGPKGRMQMKTGDDLDLAAKASLSYSLAASLDALRYVDLYDKKQWCMAEILSHTEDTISVRYEGWSRKYDEPFLSKSCARLANFRSHTVGYTGPKTVHRKFEFATNVNGAHMARLLLFVKANFTLQLSPIEVTEYVRGELFLYADTLLTMMHVFKPTLTEIQEILSFTETLLTLIIQWIKCFPQFRKEYELSKEYPNLYLTSTRTAVARCYPELMELIDTCLNVNSVRTVNSFRVSYC
eukprot:TRINITY_DN11170_c0_g2_i13.p1 TRINITY_DN11170_c0_g2~~TRINITY_DN11170_c0_g2_i13.p1  ORF type:complete len:284 (-),score=59.79 TRINITY_DN11170_c0_g2_i13:218-1045(-)